MQAIVYQNYGAAEVLRLADVEKPAPKPNEILIKVQAVHYSNGDSIARTGISPWPLMRIPARLMMGIFRPRQQVLGGEFAGRVIGTGSQVTRFKTGDEIFGFTGMQFGAFAEFLTLPETALITHRPDNVSPNSAAAIGALQAVTALHMMREAKIGPGQKVLINGASGGIGRPAVQLAKHFGAHVTGVCSTRRVDLVKKLGADAVIDYTKEDFRQNGETYDIIFDMVGMNPFEKIAQCLTPKGVHILAMFTLKNLWQARQLARRDGKRVICALAPEKIARLDIIRDLLQKGALKPVIDRTFPLTETIAAAHYVDAGRHRGAIVIEIPPSPLAQPALTHSG